jgi:Protein kinase domain
VAAPKRFVYILKSEHDPNEYYLGVTADPDARRHANNAGMSAHTTTLDRRALPCGRCLRKSIPELIRTVREERIRQRAVIRFSGRALAISGGALGQVLRQEQPRLSGADDVHIAVAIDVPHRHLQPPAALAAVIDGVARPGHRVLRTLREPVKIWRSDWRGAVPLDEVLPIAKQIAEALEAAHMQGIIHRDLKPANIKVRTDGTVKVLDLDLPRRST